MSKWQAIETAPKDGSDIIVTDGNEVVPAFFVRHDHWKEGEYDLRYSSRQQGEEFLWFTATHWQPLPDPPQLDAAQQSDNVTD